MAHLEARMRHEEESFSCAVERLTEPQRVREEGPEYLMDSHKRGRNNNTTQLKKNNITTSVIDIRDNIQCVLPHPAHP